MTASELRSDDFETGTLWRRERQPAQGDIDAVARSLNARGWNGCTLDLYRDGEWQATVKPSEEVLW